ncbi:hypothetical protein [Rhodococcus jostii]|uniref:Uncharacterized protein n=1 Tax=Rhodococcus jostii TaxID=132919 RepID=A0A1H5F125_RHOJO|nr:hypothetical protein [Rhodococcus jostii]SED97051.1 hypothetical protein SAMN04490220_6214 [Rhodococcus jostii]
MNTRFLASNTPERVAAEWATGGVRILEEAVTGLIGATEVFEQSSPWGIARREEVADRVVDVMAARAWHDIPQMAHGRARRAAARCVTYSLAADTARVDGSDDARADRGALTVHALELLTRPEHFDAVTDRTRELLGAAPQGRLLAAWQMVDDALAGVRTTRHEWVGADPAIVAAAGWVLVDRLSRLLIASALVARAATSVQSGTSGQSETPGQPDLLVNAARRYAWNHLRRPAPEAATPAHVQRSAELVRAFANPGDVP